MLLFNRTETGTCSYASSPSLGTRKEMLGNNNLTPIDKNRIRRTRADALRLQGEDGWHLPGSSFFSSPTKIVYSNISLAHENP